MRRRHVRRRGQSAVEMALLMPVVLMLFMGVYIAGSFISDLDLAGQAVRAGARLGAEVGNYGYPNNPTTAGCVTSTSPHDNTNPCVVDQNIVTSVVTIARNLANVGSVDEIDIYEPCAKSGTSCSAATQGCSPTGTVVYGNYFSGDPEDVYVPVPAGSWTVPGNWTLSGSYGYTLDLRKQQHPHENVVGVRFVFHFKAAAPFTFFNIQTSQFSAMCLAPFESSS